MPCYELTDSDPTGVSLLIRGMGRLARGRNSLNRLHGGIPPAGDL